MPIKSKAQFRLMQAAAHGSLNKSNKTGLGGPSQEVAKEFLAATPHAAKKRFASGLKKAK